MKLTTRRVATPCKTKTNLSYILHTNYFRIIFISYIACTSSWHVLLRMKVPREGVCGPIPPLELPDSLHAVRSVSQSDALDEVLFFPLFSFHLSIKSTRKVILEITLHCYRRLLKSPVFCLFVTFMHSCFVLNSEFLVFSIWQLFFRFRSLFLQNGYRTFQGGFWNYFSMGKGVKLLTPLFLCPYLLW